MSSPVYWITTVGTSPCAVVNTLWRAVAEKACVPSHVALLHSPSDDYVHEQALPACVEAIDILAEACAIPSPRVVTGEAAQFDESNPETFLTAVLNCVKQANQEKLPMVIDITAGRKYMSAILMIVGIKLKRGVQAIYYNHLKGRQYEQTPFALVPRPEHELRNMADLFRQVTPQKRGG